MVLADVERRYWAKPDVESRWTKESAMLHALPGRDFDVRAARMAVPVSAQSTVVVDGAVYWVPTTWARRTVDVRIGGEEVSFTCLGESMTRTRIGKGLRDIDYAAHYLDELSRKPQALRQVAPMLVTQLGGDYPAFWEQLEREHGGKTAARLMARILRGIKEFGQAACEVRVRDALASGQAIGVALLVDCALVGDETIDAIGATNDCDFVPAALNIVVEKSSLARFDDLLAATSFGGAV
jgi:hypothetical protein